MNPIDDIVQYIMKRADRTVDEMLVRNIVHWGFAILANRKSKRVLINGHKKIINYYGLSFSSSNSGKSWVLSMMMELLEPVEQRMMETYNGLFSELNKDPGSGQNGIANPDYLEFYTPYNKESTVQGIHKTVEALSIVSDYTGSINFYSDEFFASANESILDRLVDGHDGNYQAPKIKGGAEGEDRYFTVKGMPTNLLGLSAMDSILNEQKDMSRFIANLKRAWFKRSFITTDHDHIMDIKDPEPDAALSEKTMKYLYTNNFTDEESEITISEEAKEVLDYLRMEMIRSKGPLKKLRDPYKVLSLAAIYTVADGRSEISSEDMGKAAEFENRTFQMAVDFCDLEHDFIRAFRKLQEEEMTEVEMVKQKLLTGKQKDREETFKLIDRYAMEHNSQLYDLSDKGIVSYRVRTYDQVNGELEFSYAPWSGTKGGGTPNYNKKFKGSIHELKDLLNDSNIQLCQYLLKPYRTTGKTNRTLDNIISTSMLVFDFDKDTLALEDLAVIFHSYVAMIRQSSSWTPENHKYHVYLPLKYRLNLTHDEFRVMYENVGMKLALKGHYDKSMMKSVQPVFEKKGKKSYLSPGEMLFDPRCCIDGSIQARHTVDTYSGVNPRNRVMRYIETFLNELVPGQGREPKTNAFIWKFIDETERKPSRADMMEALHVIDKTINDPKWSRDNMKKFTKMIETHFQ